MKVTRLLTVRFLQDCMYSPDGRTIITSLKGDIVELRHHLAESMCKKGTTELAEEKQPIVYKKREKKNPHNS